MPASAEISLNVNCLFARISCRARVLESLFLHVDGRPDRGSSSAEVGPSLNLLSHSDVRARLEHSSPREVLNSSKVFAPFSPSLTQNFMHTSCSDSSWDFVRPRNATRLLYTCSFDQSWGGTRSGRPVCLEERLKATFQERGAFPTSGHTGVTKPISELIDQGGMSVS